MTMTPKQFLRKSQSKAANSALAFLAEYRDFLTTGEVASVTSPILARLDTGELLPTPALTEIKSVVFAHMMAADLHKAETAMLKAAEPKEDKPYMACIYTAKSEVVIDSDDKELIKGFATGQEAEGWVFRRLIENPGCRGEVAATKTLDNHGLAMVTHITREQAFARVYKERGMAAHKKTGVNMSKLGFGVKCKDTHVRFSSG